jgi:wyosine [tRNA(Phe)-imidazoG37] synthetase (radical SAM superfamily)
MKRRSYRYLFGPVPSRRLGYSLGVDVVPYKTCSYDCIYCQLGRTTEKTSERREHFPVDDIIGELERKMKEPGKADFITFSGSGEPTLHSGLGELVSAARRLSDIPVAVLTNGSLLWDEAVSEELSRADLVIPSLDAGNEVFLVDGVNTTEEELRGINAFVRGMRPAKVQLNTVDRPPVEISAAAVNAEGMRACVRLLDGNVEIVGDFDRPADVERAPEIREERRDLLRRRPCSIEDLAACLNIHPNEAVKYLDELEKQHELVVVRGGKKTFYASKRS